jgi:hypothetical protein
MLSCAIDGYENRDVAVCDIPGAFMQADIDELIHIRISGPMVELLCSLDPELYTPYVVQEKTEPAIYLELNKALYGTLQAAILFWKDLTGVLKELGFTLNPYDRCVANKTVNGQQLTVIWHVDDLKISHKDPEVVTQLIEDLNKRYGVLTPITSHRGKTHDYLGMTLDFTTPGACVIRMDDYMDRVLSEAPGDMEGTAESPAAEHLFEVDTQRSKLQDEKKETFHTTVAKLLFLSKRARPDILPAVSFLCTRTQAPDEDDWKKLTRVIRYLRKFPCLPLTLEIDDPRTIQWYVDASFGVHPDMKSHTGACGTLGKGMFFCASSKQKLNTRSSTESELVGVDDTMKKILWTRQFLEKQGYVTGPSVVYQDNKSTMLLANNGTWSSTKRTRHLNIRYFFVTDRIATQEVRLEYCPTGDMASDMLTKPLQGCAFRKFRAIILNLKDDPAAVTPSTPPSHRSVLENTRTTRNLERINSEVKRSHQETEESEVGSGHDRDTRVGMVEHKVRRDPIIEDIGDPKPEPDKKPWVANMGNDRHPRDMKPDEVGKIRKGPGKGSERERGEEK